MATFVETNDCKIVIDPSAALGPKRYGLPPHQKETEMLQRTKQQIKKYVEQSDILVISHYHYDHYAPEETFYNDKTVYAKDINRDINKSQKQRGMDFKQQVEGTCELIYSDHTTRSVGDTKLIFSPPFFHGPENTKLGRVIMTVVDDGEKTLIHASDVQGPMTNDATTFIIDHKPDVLIMDGPPTLFLGWKMSAQQFKGAEENLLKIIKETGCKVILDHHLLRDLKYKERCSGPYTLEKDVVQTFAEYLGKENNMLEAQRKQLWNK